MTKKLKYFIGIMLMLTGCTLVSIGGHKPSPHQPQNKSEYAKTAVMITDVNMRAGGTGVILDSRPGVSHILTNKHVCQLVQVGGKVITDDGQDYAVDGYRVYKRHDLCLIEVLQDLHINIKVAKEGPKDYDTSIVVGHPNLLPTMITTGHFSQKRTISMVVDMKPCDGTENENEAVACIFAGGKPVIQQFNAQLTSSLIMPGSSGSAVYNAKGELSGLVFAGNQGLGYGYIVPWSYVNDFLNHTGKYEQETPNPVKEPRNFFTAYFKFQAACTNKHLLNHPALCESLADLGLWHE